MVGCFSRSTAKRKPSHRASTNALDSQRPHLSVGNGLKAVDEDGAVKCVATFEPVCSDGRVTNGTHKMASIRKSKTQVRIGFTTLPAISVKRYCRPWNR